MRINENVYEDEDDIVTLDAKMRVLCLRYGIILGSNFDLISTAAERYWALLIETFCHVTHCL
jgi:hypothetical protein